MGHSEVTELIGAVCESLRYYAAEMGLATCAIYKLVVLNILNVVC